MSKITITDLSIKFRIYNDRNPSLKDHFANFFKFGSRNIYTEFLALENVSLNIEAGERVGIIGNNGAGKSTLLKTICNVYTPESGSLNVNGKIVPLLELGAGFHPDFTGRENIHFLGAILGIDDIEINKTQEEIISFAELDEFIDTPIKYYSTGMYLRLGFSIATSISPDILILDEVFSGGDASFMVKAKDRMLSLINKANIMILVSHDHTLIEKFCNRVIWLDHGKIRADGSPKDIIKQYLKTSRKNE